MFQPSFPSHRSLMEYFSELQIQTHVAQVLEEAKTNSERVVLTLVVVPLHLCISV